MTPLDQSNYTHDLLATSLEWLEGACYGRQSHRLITASDGGVALPFPRGIGAADGGVRHPASGRNSSPHLWMGLWKLPNDV